MPARVSTETPADSLRAFAGMAWDQDLMREDHPARLGISAVRNLARYAPAGKRVRLWIEWETEADQLRDVTEPTGAPFDYQSEEVGEAFTEWCAAGGIEARDDQEYRWLRQAFTAGMNEAARYADEPDEDPPIVEYDPGPEVDDQGGMSEYRYHEPEPWQ
jgi:hypothetical protein